MRDRELAAVKASFAAARDQLDRALDQRYKTFAALSDLSYVLPVMKQVAGQVDEADFGLGSAEKDSARLAALHEALTAADWATWARAAKESVIGIADYKGRLLYTSAAPEVWGGDTLGMPAVAGALRPGVESVGANVVSTEAPAARASGLFGSHPEPAVLVLFARAALAEGAPRAVYLQAIPAARLLNDVSPGGGTRLALVAPGGERAGDAPAEVMSDMGGAKPDTIVELTTKDGTWLAQVHPLRGLEERQVIAQIAMVRPLDVGLAGLFGSARQVLGVSALFLLGLCAVSAALAWRSA
jgi:hypothetical protein